MTTKPPDKSQQAFADEPLANLLLVAAAGCGKTEALAYRARALVRGGHVGSPRKLLALTYSNRARDSLSARMRVHLGQKWYESVSVTNFHGFAARVVQNHGSVLGLQRDLVLPDKTWRARRLRELGVDYRTSLSFELTLRRAKAGAPSDAEVLNRVYDSGNSAAVKFEEGLRREGRLDYDDLLRHAQRVLAHEKVAKLYRAHFAAVFVDEVQDLSLGHLRLGIAQK